MVAMARTATGPGTGGSLPGSPHCSSVVREIKVIAAGHRLGMRAGCCQSVLPFPLIPLFLTKITLMTQVAINKRAVVPSRLPVSSCLWNAKAEHGEGRDRRTCECRICSNYPYGVEENSNITFQLSFLFKH